MNKCEWCKKDVEETVIYTDAIGDNHSICLKCKDVVDSFICRKCGAVTDPSMMINGLCTNCVQVELQEKNKKREAVRLGVDRDMLVNITSDMTFTDEDYENWLTMGSSFSPENMNNKQLKRMWIMVKLNAAGIYDNEVISKNIADIEELLDRNFSKLINNACKLIIGNTSETRKIVRSSQVIDYINEAYIIKA